MYNILQQFLNENLNAISTSISMSDNVDTLSMSDNVHTLSMNNNVDTLSEYER